jgi:hypothetical protein
MTTLTFLLDFDNTLADNDHVKADQDERLRELLGAEHTAAFWETYEAVRREKEYVDYLATLARFREARPDERRFAEVAAFVLGFPFESYLFPGAPEAIAHLGELGRTAILSDGDPVYQAAKIGRSGLATAVHDLVFIYAHKQDQLGDVTRRLPADRYVLVDDKAGVLAACKERLGERALTVHVRQGKYARQPQPPGERPPDHGVAAIGDLAAVDASFFRGASR